MSRDVGFWKETVNDEIDSILYNNTWTIVDLPPVPMYLDANGFSKENIIMMNQFKLLK